MNSPETSWMIGKVRNTWIILWNKLIRSRVLNIIELEWSTPTEDK